MIKYFFFSTQNVSINFLQVEPDGLCMARAILLQVVHDPHKYSAEMLMPTSRDVYVKTSLQVLQGP